MTTATVPPSPELDAFVRQAKQHGVPDDALVSLLRQNGWPIRRVYRSIGRFYTDDLGLALPVRGGGSVYARDAFYYLLNFLALGSWVTALGGIFYALIDRTFRDPAVPAYLAANGSLVHEIAWHLATVIVAFPVFVALHLLIERDLRTRADAADSGVRAWLTYLALVVAAAVALGDLICFLSAFLTGGLAVRFELQTLVVLVLSSGTFAYYLWSLRSRPAA
jgi:hypothetical protein